MVIRSVYITEKDFLEEYYLRHPRRFYTGFIIGVGYAYVHNVAVMPPDQRGYARCPDICPEDNSYYLTHIQQIDTSPEMKRLSLRAGERGEFAEITVMRGETLGGLAGELGVAVEELVRWNHIADPDNIAAGRSLLVKCSDENISGRIARRESQLSATLPGHESEGGLSGLLKALRTPVGYISYASLIPTVIGGMKYTNNIMLTNVGGFWRGANGRYYSSAQATPGSGRGYNFRANSMAIAKGAAPFKYLRYTGIGLGLFTSAYSGYLFYQNPNWKDGLDTGFGAAGLLYWPVGAAYFVGKLYYKGALNYTRSMIENGLVPGRDDLIIWK